IEMPKLSDTMSQGRILSWMKKEGDPVKAGDVLAEIESDKANMEMEAYDSGFVRKLLVPVGGSAQVGAPIAIVTESADEDISDAWRRAGPGAKAPPKEASPPAAEPPAKAGKEKAMKEEPRAATVRAAPQAPFEGRAPLPKSVAPAGNGQRKARASPLA